MEEILAELQATRAQMTAQAEESSRQVALMTQQITYLNTQRQEQEVRLDELRRTATLRGESQSSRQFFEPKGLQRPKDFTNTEAAWPEFSFKFKNWFAGAIKGARTYLVWAEDHIGPIVNLENAPTELQEAAVVELNIQLYVVLAQLLSEESLTILQNGIEDQGLDAWRRLAARWDPNTTGRSRNAFTKIMLPGVFTMDKLSAAIEDWEKAVRQHENRRKKEIDEELKSSVIIEMCPKLIKTHLQLNARTLKDYTSIRAEIMSYLETRRDNVASSTTAAGNDMDVDAFSKGGKGKGKGGKGDRLDGGKGGKSGLVCWTCGKSGHVAADCRSGAKGKDAKGKDSKGKDAKGKSKGKDNGKGGKGTQKFQGYCSKCWKWGHKQAECRSDGGKKGVNSIEEETPQDDGADLGGFDLCGLEKLPIPIREKIERFAANDMYHQTVEELEEEKRQAQAKFREKQEQEQNESDVVLPTVQHHMRDGASSSSCSTQQHESVMRAEETILELNAVTKEARKVVRTIKATIDSGAAVSVVPVDCCTEYPVRPSKASQAGVHYKAANGKQLPDLGDRTISARTPEGATCRVRCSVAAVHKVLLSVAKICDQGNVVQFGARPDQCFILNEKTGKKTMIKRENDVFILELDVLKPTTDDSQMKQLSTVQEQLVESDEVTMSGGIWQARP